MPCESVEAAIEDPERAIVDVRAQAEYDGERFWPSGATEGPGRPGRIPGSRHVPISLFRTDDGMFRDAGEIETALRDHGLTPESASILHCTIGNRAAQAWFAMSYLLDYPETTVYYGSWAEWGSRADTPVER